MNKSIFLATPGRCGTHWVRPILSHMLNLVSGLQGYNPNNVAFRTDSDFVWVMKRKEKEKPGGSIFIGHTPPGQLVPLVGLVNIIIVVRDPRDICVSATYYHMRSGEFSEKEFSKKLSGMLFNGGPNPDFNESFLKDIDKVPHVLLRFEDMIKDSYGAMTKLLDSCNYGYDEERLKFAIERYSFKILSKGRDPGEENRMDHYRKGVIGDWKNYLTEEMNQEFCDRHSELMKAWGYSG